jgi:hypothetical protein
MKCEECNNEVSKEREEFGCGTCYNCASKKPRVRGVMIYDNLTAVGLQVVPGERFDRVKHLFTSTTDNIPVVES